MKLYLFGITYAQTRPDFGGLPGLEADHAPFGICEGALQAIVCQVERDTIASAISQQDRARLGAFILTHDTVISAVMASAPVLPASFGTLLDTAEVLRELLNLNQVAWGERLDTLVGCVEMGLKVYLDLAALQASLPMPAPVTAGAGANYLLQRKFELERQRHAEHLANQKLDQIHTACQALTREALLKPLEGALAAEEGLALRAIYLIHRDEIGPLRELVDQLNSEAADWCEISLDGPFAPYHFVGGQSV